MARMIPPFIYPGCASQGEREIFLRLKDDPATTDWIVLHSLDIAQHQRQVSGEADFVVIVPKKGVLCLEVKGCTSVWRKDGLWYYGTDPKGDARGPFRQASNAMHSLRKHLIQAKPGLASVVFWSAVVFPFVPLNITSGEWHPWQVIDRSLFAARPLAKSLETILDRARKHIQDHGRGGWFDPALGEPSLEQCEIIARSFRPHFEFVESSKSRAERLNKELKHYTEEQYTALDAMESNPRVIFKGPAGTGKTVLAIEAARRARAAGRRVLFLCFNHLLSQRLQEEAADLKPEVKVKTLHSHMLDIAGAYRGNAENDPHFWQTILPNLASERLMGVSGDEYCFDELIIDEAQDVLRKDYLDFLDLSLKGGLATGRWQLFGDFEKQAIYSSADLKIEEVVRSRVGEVPTYLLRFNCRNTPRIAETTHLLGGLDPPYKRILRPDNGIEPVLRYYKSAEEQQALLIDVIERLDADGFSREDVVILSTKADAGCVASQINTQPWKGRLRPYVALSKNHTRFCTVHAFKGLEAPVIIVTDVDRISDSTSLSIFYVATTRAVERLVMLVHEPVKNEIIRALL